MPRSETERDHGFPSQWPGEDPRQPAGVVVIPLPARPRRRHGAGVRPAHARGRPPGRDRRRDGRPRRRTCEAADWFAATGRGSGVLVVDGVIAVDTHVGDRVATELVGPGDLLQAWEQGIDDLLERTVDMAHARAVAACAARRRLRRARAALAADLQCAHAPRRPARRRPERAARDHDPAPPRGAPVALAVAPGRALRTRRAGRDPPPPAADAPAARPPRRRRAAVGVARPRAAVDARASSPGMPTNGICTARRPRTWPRWPSARRNGAPPRTRITGRAGRDAADGVHPAPVTDREAARPRRLDDERPLCDGDSVALTAATSPSLEDLHPRHDPGHAGARDLQPPARLRVGRGVRQGLVRRRGGQARSVRARRRGLDPQRAHQRRRPLGRVRGGSAERPADPDVRVDRPARAEGRGRAGRRHVRGLRRRPGDEGTTRPARWGFATTSAPAGARAWGCRS